MGMSSWNSFVSNYVNFRTYNDVVWKHSHEIRVNHWRGTSGNPRLSKSFRASGIRNHWNEMNLSSNFSFYKKCTITEAEIRNTGISHLFTYVWHFSPNFLFICESYPFPFVSLLLCIRSGILPWNKNICITRQFYDLHFSIRDQINTSL